MICLIVSIIVITCSLSTLIIVFVIHDDAKTLNDQYEGRFYLRRVVDLMKTANIIWKD